MKILHLSERTLAGSPYRITRALVDSGLEARLITNQNQYYLAEGKDPDQQDQQVDLLLDRLERDQVAQLLEQADLIHYHNGRRRQSLFSRYPWAWPMVSGKPSIIHFHSPRIPIVEDDLADPSLTKLVVAQYHVRLYPECIPVPNVVPIDDPLHRPLVRSNPRPTIAFTPSQITQGGWHHKGYAETMPILKRGFSYRFATGKPWHEVMALRGGCDLAIDEIVTGSYHMNSLEALSQGLVTIAGLDSLTLDALEKVTGTRNHPWVVAGPDTLEETLRCLVHEPERVRELGHAARNWMTRYWHPETHAQTFARIYEQALAGSLSIR